MRPVSESQFQYSKRSKTSPPTQHSKIMINIDDLPDHLLFEIILRLPFKSVAQYKCVSKRWFALISHHSFLSRFLCLQCDNRKPLPMEPTLIFLDEKKEFFSISGLPMFKTGCFSLKFLPCYQSAANQKETANLPVVVGACNDLVLCCATESFQRDYYICNPYTKQWVGLPPSLQCRDEVRVGFICDPYYYYKEHVDRREKYSSIIQLNVDYRYAIVRVLPPSVPWYFSNELNVEIFSSETGKWTHSVILSPRSFCFEGLACDPGLAYKGMLYWPNELDGHIIGLDPFSNNNNNNSSNTDNKYYCQVIDCPAGEWGSLSVNRHGRLRLYRAMFRDEHNGRTKYLSVWELKDDDDDDKVDGGVEKWCLISNPPLDRMVSENPLISEWSRSSDQYAVAVAFDPNNDDILYLQSYDHIVMCNIRANMLKEATTTCGNLVLPVHGAMVANTRS